MPSISSDALSGGTIAGIVVGTVAGFALLVLGFFLLFRHRRINREATLADADASNQYSAARGHGAEMGQSNKQLPGLPDNETTWTGSPATLGATPTTFDSQGRMEMPGHHDRYELDASHNANELDAGYKGAEMRGW
jgi:hypothetical protein